MPPQTTSARPRIEPLPPIDRARQVTEALASYIDRASLQAGDRLPGASGVRVVMDRDPGSLL